MKLKERYFQVLDSLSDHIFVLSESGTYVDVFGGKDSVTGFYCQSFIGSSLYDVNPIDLAKEFHSYIKKALETNHTQFVRYQIAQQEMTEYQQRAISSSDDNASPADSWFEAVVKPIDLIVEGERCVVWIVKNVTQKHLLEARLKRLSEKDDLTGIANRRTFTDSLAKALQLYQLAEARFSVLVLDLDWFKRINDSYGHSCGDEVIQHVVNVLKSELRAYDSFGRIGGEEFAIILPELDLQKAKHVAEKLRKKLENSPIQSEGHSITMTVSIGVTELIESDHDIKTVLCRADRAMYNSKNNGRNRVSIYDAHIEDNSTLCQDQQDK